MNYQCKSRVVLITGGSRGIGLGVVKALAQENYQVVATCRKVPPALNNEFQNVNFLQLDCTKETEITHLASLVNQRYGRLDAVIANLGQASFRLLMQESLENFRRSLLVNCLSTWLLVKAFAELLICSKGTVVAVSSTAASQSKIGSGLYSSSKAALEAMIETWQLELPSLPFFLLTPGLVSTEAMQKEEYRAMREKISSQCPMQRLGTTAEVAQAVLNIIENKNSLGMCVPVTGGQHLIG